MNIGVGGLKCIMKFDGIIDPSSNEKSLLSCLICNLAIGFSQSYAFISCLHNERTHVQMLGIQTSHVDEKFVISFSIRSRVIDDVQVSFHIHV